MPSTDDRDRELNRFWNAVASGEPVAGEFALDQDEMDLIRRLHDLGHQASTSSPAAGAWSRVLAGISDPNGAQEEGSLVNVTDLPSWRIAPNGVAHPSSHRVVPPVAAATSRTWGLGQLATAALLVLTLGLGYATFRASGPDRQGSMLPAVVATPAATPATATETTPLLRLTLTPPWMRGVTWQGIARATYAPGAHTREASISSPQLYFVETGTFTVRSLEGEPPTRVAGGTILSLPRTATPTVGGELRLSVGDALLLPAGSTVELHNAGDVQATILGLLSDSGNTTVENTGKITKNLTFTVVDRRGGDWAKAPPMAVALDRVMLAPDAVLADPGSGALVAVGAAQPLTYGQRSALRTEPGGSLQNTGAIPLDVYVLSVAAVPSATPAASTPSG